MFKRFSTPLLSILFGVSSFLLYGCASFKTLEYRGVNDWKVSPISFSNSNLSAKVLVYNPNTYPIKIKKIDAAIQVEGSDWGSLLLDSTFYMPAKSEFAFPVLLTVGNGKLISSALAIASGREVGYFLKGRIKGGRKNITAEVPFEYSGLFTEKDISL